MGIPFERYVLGFCPRDNENTEKNNTYLYYDAIVFLKTNLMCVLVFNILTA